MKNWRFFKGSATLRCFALAFWLVLNGTRHSLTRSSISLR